MRVRYENWVKGLKGDWLVSRQRFFGVPFPLWYRVDADGQVNYDDIITPSEAALPVDPSTDVPEGYTKDQRGVAGGFVGELDIMDTWATSSLSPQLACGWLDDEDLFARTYPMDLRPQGQDIIRTWLFSTVVRADLEFGALPWKHAGLSGWILDSDHKKMSKSKGNVVTPHGHPGEVRVGCRALLGGVGSPGPGCGVRRAADEDWSPPGDQGAERVEVCAHDGRRGRGD